MQKSAVFFGFTIVSQLFDQYYLQHIRPLAVSPLNYSGSVPTPWGFFLALSSLTPVQGVSHE